MITQIDFAILDYIQQHLSNSVSDKIMSAITHLGDYGLLWIGLCIVLMAVPRTRKSGFALAIAMIAGLVMCNLLLKNIVARPRPFVINDFPIIIPPPHGYSVPSGHSSNSFIAATVIGMRYKKFAIPSYVLATLIALSRIYLYVHYPSDVITGAVCGIIIGYITVRVCGRYNKAAK